MNTRRSKTILPERGFQGQKHKKIEKKKLRINCVIYIESIAIFF